MAKTSMPEVGGGDGDVSFGDSGGRKVVERAGTVTSENHDPAGKSLHRKAKGIKFNCTIIINGELTNRD